VEEMKELKKGLKNHVCDDEMHNLMVAIHNHSGITIRSYLITVYIFALLAYIGIFFGLLSVNFEPQPFIEGHYYLPFHLLAFWGVFVFTVIEAFVLILSKLATKSKLQSVLLSFNIISTLMTGVLFTIYPEFYEVPAHYLEYSIQIAISGVNFLFVIELMRRKKQLESGTESGDGSSSSSSYNQLIYKFIYLELVFAVLVILLSIFQLFFYSGLIQTGIEPERVGHFCEFVNEIANGMFALWYATSVYFDIQKELKLCNQSIQQHHTHV